MTDTDAPAHVITPDPDNTRKVRVVERATGRLVAEGHLAAAPPPADLEPGTRVAMSVQFIGRTV